MPATRRPDSPTKSQHGFTPQQALQPFVGISPYPFEHFGAAAQQRLTLVHIRHTRGSVALKLHHRLMKIYTATSSERKVEMAGGSGE